MNIMELGAIGELVGGVAVVGSLIYLALQVRQSNEGARAASIREVAGETNQVLLKLCDPHMSQVVRTALHDFNGLSHNDQTVAAGFLSVLFRMAETTFTVRSSPRPAQLERLCASWVASNGVRPWWSASKKTFNPRFVEELESLKASALPLEELLPWFQLEDSERDGS